MGRFSGKGGEEYDLFKLSCPHLDKIEGKVGEVIGETFSGHTDEIKVLELGPGTGLTTKIILEISKKIKVLAVDNEEIMAEQLGENLRHYIEEGRLGIILEDGLEFLKEQKEESFDVFASAFTLHNFDQEYRKKILQEIFRVLKKDGLFVNADKYSEDDENAHKKSLAWQIDMAREQFAKAGRPDLADFWIEHYLEDDRPNLRMNEGGAIRVMDKLGFRDIKKVFREKMEAVIVARK